MFTTVLKTTWTTINTISSLNFKLTWNLFKELMFSKNKLFFLLWFLFIPFTMIYFFILLFFTSFYFVILVLKVFFFYITSKLFDNAEKAIIFKSIPTNDKYILLIFLKESVWEIPHLLSFNIFYTLGKHITKVNKMELEYRVVIFIVIVLTIVMRFLIYIITGYPFVILKMNTMLVYKLYLFKEDFAKFQTKKDFVRTVWMNFTLTYFFDHYSNVEGRKIRLSTSGIIFNIWKVLSINTDTLNKLLGKLSVSDINLWKAIQEHYLAVSKIALVSQQKTLDGELTKPHITLYCTNNSTQHFPKGSLICYTNETSGKLKAYEEILKTCIKKIETTTPLLTSNSNLSHYKKIIVEGNVHGMGSSNPTLRTTMVPAIITKSDFFKIADDIRSNLKLNNREKLSIQQNFYKKAINAMICNTNESLYVNTLNTDTNTFELIKTNSLIALNQKKDILIQPFADKLLLNDIKNLCLNFENEFSAMGKL